MAFALGSGLGGDGGAVFVEILFVDFAVYDVSELVAVDAEGTGYADVAGWHGGGDFAPA